MMAGRKLIPDSAQGTPKGNKTGIVGTILGQIK